MGYELRTRTIEPFRSTFQTLIDRFGDESASRAASRRTVHRGEGLVEPPGRALQRPLRRMPMDLRPVAAEACPGMVARAADLAGQLGRTDDTGGPRLVRRRQGSRRPRVHQVRRRPGWHAAAGVGVVTVKALGRFEFPARDRQGPCGDDHLVNVLWAGSVFICSAVCFRVPKAMTLSDFKSQTIDAWASGDPDYRPQNATGWRIDEEEINPRPTETVTDPGIPHEGLIGSG